MARFEVRAPVAGTIWMHSVSLGQQVAAGSTVAIMECMKMEFPVVSDVGGTVVSLADAGAVVEEGAIVAVIED